MEQWVPLLEIFLKSACAVGEASYYIKTHQSKGSPLASGVWKFVPHLLSKNVVFYDEEEGKDQSAGTHSSRISKCMWIETLPSAMQSSILTFLSVEHGHFRTKDLQLLAQILVAKPDLDFWVRRAAENLFFTFVGHIAPPFSTVDQGPEMDEYNALPKFLDNYPRGSNSLFPWIPMAFEDAQITASDARESLKEGNVLQSKELPDEKTEYSNKAVSEINLCVPDAREPVGERKEESRYTADHASGIQHATSCISVEAAGSEALASSDANIVDQGKVDSKLALDPEIYVQATSLREALLSFDSNSFNNASIISEKMRTLCMFADSREVLGFIKPWEVSDEVTLQLVESLLKEQEGYAWSTDMLCSLILPKLLSLTQPASRILVTAVLQAGKVHQRATVDALLLPLILYKKGLNIAVCEVLQRLIKDCLQAEQVCSFFQKLLCEEIQQQHVICLPCHQNELSQILVWTEPVFTLFQNILNHPMSLTQEVLDLLVLSLDDVAEEFSKSLKFSNFLLCLVNKHASLLKHHKGYLQGVVEKTGTFMTKSILTKVRQVWRFVRRRFPDFFVRGIWWQMVLLGDTADMPLFCVIFWHIVRIFTLFSLWKDRCSLVFTGADPGCEHTERYLEFGFLVSEGFPCGNPQRLYSY